MSTMTGVIAYSAISALGGAAVVAELLRLRMSPRDISWQGWIVIALLVVFWPATVAWAIIDKIVDWASGVGT